MSYTEAQRKATNKWRKNNIERTRELNRKHITKWLENNKELHAKKELEKYHIKKQIKEIMLILIDENI
jgi:uncharacterized protein YaiL (DUF2058 family)